MPLGSTGKRFNGGTITQPLVIAPSSAAGSVPLTLHGPTGSFAANGNIVEWYDDNNAFRGSLAARGGMEIDLGAGTSGVTIFPPNFQAGITVSETAGAPAVGFYGAGNSPQQTGVAVTAAAIHAALVTLGLITA